MLFCLSNNTTDGADIRSNLYAEMKYLVFYSLVPMTVILMANYAIMKIAKNKWNRNNGSHSWKFDRVRWLKFPDEVRDSVRGGWVGGYLSVLLSVGRFVCVAVWLSGCPSVRLSVRLSVYESLKSGTIFHSQPEKYGRGPCEPSMTSYFRHNS